jgi:ATP-dependent Clp protease ATP-binding subunit ClpC
MAAMYPFERFTEAAKEVLTLAQEEAERTHSNFIGTEHLLLGLLGLRDTTAGEVLHRLGVELSQVRDVVSSGVHREDRLIKQRIPVSRVKKVIEDSFEEALRTGSKDVATQHLLLGLLIDRECVAGRILRDLGASLERVRVEIALVEAAGTAADEGTSAQ